MSLVKKAGISDPAQSSYQTLMSIDVECEVDARALSCPMPLLKAKQALNALTAGDRLRVLASDGGSVRDFHAYARLSGHSILAFTVHQNEYYYVILKAG